jgi:hypothetical protein
MEFKMPSFMTPSTRIAKWILAIIISIILFALLAGSALSYFANQKLENILKSTGSKFDGLNINLFLRSVTIHGFEFTLPGDSATTKPTTAQVERITLHNIGLYQIIVKKNLNIDEFIIENGNIQINQKTTFEDSTSFLKKPALRGISIAHLYLKNLTLAIAEDSLLQYSGILDLNIHTIQSADTRDLGDLKAYRIKDIDGKITKVLINHSQGLYQTKVSAIHTNSKNGKLILDSILLIPQYSKYKFSRAANKQIDRINTFIERVEVSDFLYDQFRDSVFVASKIVISSAEVHSFRDKRMPFREKVDKPLPMEALRKLNVSIAVDTIQLKDSKVIYEEFPAEGFNSGRVTFENLQATLTNLRNRIDETHPTYALLKANAHLMGKGLIEASFTLPIEENKPYHAEGKINKMSLHHINPALENLAFISIESGVLNEINFNFDYTNESSTGNLTINYQNLKINGLKKKKSAIINDLKTFLINTIIKNDKDKSVSTLSRTAPIAFERDKKRQIFNYWWKSLWSGIKDSVLN